MPQTIFMSTGHGDLTIEWNEAEHDKVIAGIQTLMEKGVSFHRLEEQGKLRKKTVAIPIAGVAEIGDNKKLLIKDEHIRHFIDGGLATIVTWNGVTDGDIKTVGRVDTAEEAAKTDTVAARPARGG